MLQQIITRLLQQLLDTQLLILTESASLTSLVDDVLRDMPHAGFGAQFGSWLSATLIAHPSVDELFVSDEELTDMLRYIQS